MIDFKRFFSSFGFALDGLSHAFKRDQNLRIHLFFAIIVLIAAFLFHVAEIEFIVLILTICLVFISELINTTVEKIVDFMVYEHVPEAKFIKDVSAGMVFVSALGAVIIGLIIFLPKL